MDVIFVLMLRCGSQTAHTESAPIESAHVIYPIVDPRITLPHQTIPNYYHRTSRLYGLGRLETECWHFPL